MTVQITRKFFLGCFVSLVIISAFFLLVGGLYFWGETQCCGLVVLIIFSIAIIAIFFAEPELATTLMNFIDRSFKIFDDVRTWLTGYKNPDE